MSSLRGTLEDVLTKGLMRAVVASAALATAAAAACSSFEGSDSTSASSGDAGEDVGSGAAGQGDAGEPDAGVATADAGVGAEAADASYDLHCGAGLRCSPRVQVCCVDAGAASCTGVGACAGIDYACTEAANCAAFASDASPAYCCLVINLGKPLDSVCTQDKSCGKTFHDFLCSTSADCPNGEPCVATADYQGLPLAYHCQGFPQ